MSLLFFRPYFFQRSCHYFFSPLTDFDRSCYYFFFALPIITQHTIWVLTLRPNNFLHNGPFLTIFAPIESGEPALSIQLCLGKSCHYYFFVAAIFGVMLFIYFLEHNPWWSCFSRKNKQIA